MIKNLITLLNTSTPGIDSIEFNGNYSIVDGTTWQLATQSISGNLYWPTSYYYNGNTYSVVKRNQVSSDGTVVIIKYSGDINNVDVTNITDTALHLDYHDYPVLTVDSSGYIWVMLEQHGLIPRVYKSDLPEDITSFTKQTLSGVGGRNYDYPKFGYTSDLNFFMLARWYEATGTQWGLRFHTSVDGATWVNGGKITEALDEGGATDTRHYPYIPINFIQGDYVHFLFMKRMYVGDPWVEPYAYTMKTPRNPATFGKVWSNYQETFSKDISIDGLITEAELNANYLVIEDQTLTNVNASVSGVISDNELFYNSDLGGNGMFRYNSGWSKFSDLKASQNRDSRLYQRGSMSFNRMAEDLQSIDYYGNVATPPPVKGSSIIPVNLDDIPNGQKFMVPVQDLTNGSSNTGTEFNDVYLYECVK